MDFLGCSISQWELHGAAELVTSAWTCHLNPETTTEGTSLTTSPEAAGVRKPSGGVHASSAAGLLGRSLLHAHPAIPPQGR